MFYTPVNSVAGLQLASPRSVGVSSLVLASGQGARVTALPTRITVVTAGTYGTTAELSTIFGVTAVSGDTLTITGPLEGTLDRNYVAGDYVDLRVTAGYVSDLNTAMIGGSSAPGGANTQVQYNNSGVFAGSSGFTFVPSTGTLFAVNMAGAGAAITGLNASNIVTGTVSASRLPTVGLIIAQHISPIGVASDGPTITFNLAANNWWQTTLGGNRVLALAGVVVGQQFTLEIQQAASGGPYNPIWFPGITWFGPPYTVPAMPNTALAWLSVTMKCVGTGVYHAWWTSNSAS